MPFHKLISAGIFAMLLYGDGVIFTPLVQGEPETMKEQQFSTVEERRLHVKIIEEHDSLMNQKKELLLKEQTLKTLEADIDRKLEEIDKKLDELEKNKRTLQELLSKKDEAEQLRLKNLGKVYENMIPVQAARALSKLDVETAAKILAAMSPRSAAKIINGFSADRASEITRQLITRPD